jgi:nicotinamidase-related amidase
VLIDRDSSSLLLIDVQDRLLGTIYEWQRLLDQLVWLVSVAKKLHVPVLASEQYAKGLGPTHAALRNLLPESAVVDKLHFSCVAAQCFDGMSGAERRQIVICGIESHVCVQQTALDLRRQGREVFVVADAVGSRNPGDRDLALARMRGHGIEIVSREMVVFEWLRRAGTDEFKAISTEFLR